MPVRPLPLSPSLAHLKHQAKDLLKSHAARSPQTAQQLREFHPRFAHASDAEIFLTPVSLADAQLAIAREHGFPSWARLKRRIEHPTPAEALHLPHHERIEDPTFRRAVTLLDSGDEAGLSSLLQAHPNLIHQHLLFEGGNYFRTPTLLEFIAENPIRHQTLPPNILNLTRILLHAGPSQTSRNEALMLVATGSVPRDRNVQLPLIDLLCKHGADPNTALRPAAVLGELGSVHALLSHGATLDLPVAAALGRIAEVHSRLDSASRQDRHLALALAVQYAHTEIVRLLLDTGLDPNLYNPPGGHSHGTLLHHAAGAGHLDIVRLLIERGARLDLKDVLWHATPAEWAAHESRTGVEQYLRALEP